MNTETLVEKISKFALGSMTLQRYANILQVINIFDFRKKNWISQGMPQKNTSLSYGSCF